MTQASRYWRVVVRLNYEDRCWLTGVTEKTDKLQAHHLNSQNRFPELINEPLNGILITAVIHKHFHKHYGRGGNTVHDFEAYCRRFYKDQFPEGYLFPWQNGNLKFKTLYDLQQFELDHQLYTVKNLQDCRLAFEESVKAKNYNFMFYSLKSDPTNSPTDYTSARNNHATIYCPKHNKTHMVVVRGFTATINRLLPCCYQVVQSEIRFIGQISENDLVQRFLLLVQNKGHVFEGFKDNIFLTARTTQASIYCTIHNQKHFITVKNYERSKYGVNCCISKGVNVVSFLSAVQVEKRLPGLPSKEDLIQRFLLLVENRKHTFEGFESGTFKTAKTTTASIYCSAHDKKQLIKMSNYERNKSGLSCCK